VLYPAGADVVDFATLDEPLIHPYRRSEPHPQPMPNRCKFTNNITLVPRSFQKTGYWVWRTNITRASGVALRFSISYVQQIWPDPSCNSVFYRAEHNTKQGPALCLRLFPEPRSPQLAYATTQFISTKQAFSTHNHPSCTPHRPSMPSKLSLCVLRGYRSCMLLVLTYIYPILYVPCHSMHLPIVFGSVRPIVRNVHTVPPARTVGANARFRARTDTLQIFYPGSTNGAPRTVLLTPFENSGTSCWWLDTL
jgi:hypothetical protein